MAGDAGFESWVERMELLGTCSPSKMSVMEASSISSSYTCSTRALYLPL
ncbi:hypothetical protein HMPREF0724_11463 [Prescottella equi ATCC 33707]|uniref:Uncharacterized protein n=1 Tax=Prescottella equi ATCC 33707 TaxID=525370 RepID=E9SZH1_RHOHA|nr:hypothetical protein HMPREF0724_11463 [Prescottella equi ATCC 33707]